MTTTKEHGSLAAALAALQTRLPRIDKPETARVKTKTGDTYSYSYATLAQISRLVLPLMGDLGMSWITKPMLLDDGRLVLEYKLMHVSGESEEGHYPLPSSGSPQEIGSAITYARRYTLCSVTGVAPEEDDDDGATATVAHAGKSHRDRARDVKPPDPAVVSNFVDRAYAMTTPDELRGLYASAGAAGLLDAEGIDGEGEPTTIKDLLIKRADELKAQTDRENVDVPA